MLCHILIVRDTANTPTGSFHWILALQGIKYPSGAEQPAIWHLHAAHPLLTACSTDHALVRHAKKLVRSPGTTIQNLLVEGIHAF